jgi:restriction system protein
MQAGAALSELADSVKLTAYESGHYEGSGGRRFEKIVRFATVDCVKAGWLVKQKGKWSLTVAGIQAFNKITDPENFYREAVKLYNKWKALQKGKISDLAGGGSETEDAIETSAGITLEEAEEQALNEIKNYIAVMPPYEFQEMVADLLKAMSYHVSWTAPPGKDGGVDIIAYTDPLGTRAPRIKVQVKRQKHSVDLPGLKSFLANVNEGDVGIYVCTGGFTKDAADHARSQERRRLTPRR